MRNQCSACSKCELFQGKLTISEDVKIMYKYHYCLSGIEKWKDCKRFVFTTNSGFCPDFVMPNSLLTIDQIWHKAQL